MNYLQQLRTKIIKKLIPGIILSSRWLLLPFLLKLFWTLALLAYNSWHHGTLSKEDLMQTLEDVDIAMIANLVKMIIVGSYTSFIDSEIGSGKDKVTSGELKTNMAKSIMGVSSIHLLNTFIDSSNIPTEVIYRQVIIHAMFILGSLVLAIIDFMHNNKHSETKQH